MKKMILVAAAAVLLTLPGLRADDGDGELTGAVEVLYRSVNVDGSERKYDEDYDGLESGGRLAHLELDWNNADSRFLDFARLDVQGLGGDPYERSAFRMGRKDVYEFEINYWKQDYIYDLFELVPDEDGARWDAERQRTDVGLTVYPTEDIKLYFQYDETRRTGSSLFMKDISRNLFRLDSPLDQTARRYTVGANFAIGKVDLVFRQMLRRYDNQFVNETEDNLGLEEGAELDFYDWEQSDTGGSDWTTVAVHAPLGSRADLTVSLFGTFLGEEEIRSRVNVEALGIDFTGEEFGGTCSQTGDVCNSDATCEEISPDTGNVCVPNVGFNNTDLDGDTTMIDADLAVDIVASLTLHVQYRSLDQDLDGESFGDLETGMEPTRVDTTHDYEIDTLTGLLDWRPLRQLRLRLGYRTIDRELVRDGFGTLRDTDFESDDDDTIILGLVAAPTDWFKLVADYEEGDITQPFNAVAPQDRDRLDVRATFTPRPEMNLSLNYRDFAYRNTAPDIRSTESWDTDVDGTSWSAAFWHKPNARLDYLFRYAQQEIDSRVGVVFDTEGFGGVEPGESIFDNENTQLFGQINFSWSDPWRVFVRYTGTESDGDNLLLGDLTEGGVVNDLPIVQDYDRAEIGLSYLFASGLSIGGSFADFDYDDDNDVLDYDGQIVSVRLGTRF